MPLKQDNIERQLAAAKEELAARTKLMEADGISEKECRKDPAWRQLRARCRRLGKRHMAAGEILAITEEANARRAEAQTAE